MQQETPLESARRLVAEGEQRMVEQMEQIIRLRQQGEDTTAAAQMLDNMKDEQRARLDRLAKEEAVAIAPPPLRAGTSALLVFPTLFMAVAAFRDLPVLPFT